MLATTARNASLSELAELLKVQHDTKFDAVVYATNIHSVDGQLVIDGMGLDGPAGKPGVYRPTEIMDGNLADKLGIPVKYLRRLRAERVGLYDANVNGWLRGEINPGHEGVHVGEPDPRRFFVRGFVDTESGVGIGRALMSDSYRVIDNLDVLTACLDAVREIGDTTIEVAACDLSERRMVVKINAPDIQVWARELLAGYRSPFDRRSGDELPVITAGFRLSNSETGNGAFALAPFMTIQVCKNGLVRDQDALKAVHLGSKMDEGVVPWSDETLQRNLALVASQTKDAVRAFLNVEYMEKVVAEITRKAVAEVTDAARTVELVGNQLRYSDEQISGVLDHFIRGGQMTAGGVMQAVTSYAQTVENPDVAYELEGSALAALDLAAR